MKRMPKVNPMSNVSRSAIKKNYRIALWWKLHIDTGEPLPVAPKDHETSYFKVEGKKRPAIVWYGGTTHSLLVLLTTQNSPHVLRLGKLKGDERISYFDPRRIERYSNKMKVVDDLKFELSDEQKRLVLEEIDRYSMKSRPAEQAKKKA